MQKVYVVLTHTGTILSRIIRMYTKNEYTHVSLAFDSRLHEMYSFGRLNPYIAFVGGLIREHLTMGTFKRFKKTVTSVYELEVTDEDYRRMKQFVLAMYKKRKEYKFNVIGLFCVPLQKKIERKNAYYCAEFVKLALNSGSSDFNYLPEVIKPEDFKQLINARLIYKGSLRKFRSRIRELEPKNVKPIVIKTKAAV